MLDYLDDYVRRTDVLAIAESRAKFYYTPRQAELLELGNFTSNQPCEYTQYLTA